MILSKELILREMLNKAWWERGGSKTKDHLDS